MGKKKSAEELNIHYADELLAACLKSKRALATMVEHLQPQWLPTEEHGKVFKAIKSYYTVHQKPISLGVLMQKFENDDEVVELLSDVRNIDVEDADVILEELEEFIKDSLFVEASGQMVESWNKGSKDKAKDLFKSYSDQIHNFTLKATTFTTVFGGFENRQLLAKANRITMKDGEVELKVQFNIDELNIITGYAKKGNVYCYLASSGVGKSTALRGDGVWNALLGLPVLHVQLEGSEQAVQEGYDGTWTKVHTSTLEHGLIDPEMLQSLVENAEKVRGEIFIRAFEKFSSASTVDVRQAILDIIKSHNVKPALVIVDYLEKLSPSGKRTWRPEDERHRREAIADELVNLAVEFDLVIFTATQANDVHPEKLNDPNFYLTRNNISEAKGLTRPLTFLASLNQTQDEYEDEIVRIFVDKYRFGKAKQKFRIFQNRSCGRFYDRKRTLNLKTV